MLRKYENRSTSGNPRYHRKQEIETQEELASALNARGIRVTQATVSRDIKELRLLKVLTPSGKYKYATGDQADNNLTDRFIRMLAESLLSVSSANNLIVVKPCRVRRTSRRKHWTVCTGRRCWGRWQATTRCC